MNTVSNFGVGRYRASEKDLQVYSKGARPGNAARVILALHGSGGDALQFNLNQNPGGHVQALADAGFYVVSIDAGGSTTWGNDTAMQAITDAYNYAIASLGSGAKVGILGWSMGGMNALNWLKRNPAKVSRMLLGAPASDLGAEHADATFTAAIDTAYANNYAVNSVGHDPILEPVTFRGLARTKIYHAQDDATIAVTRSRAFVAAVADPAIDLVETAVGGHLGVWSPYPTADTVAYFQAAAW